MEKPNYRINEIEKDYFDAKIIARVSLRNNESELEERTFCFFHDTCREHRSDEDAESCHQIGCGDYCTIDGDVGCSRY